MTKKKKDFIKKIREFNEVFRRSNEGAAYGAYINGIFFFFDRTKLKFDDDMEELFIYDRSKRIVACIPYAEVKICCSIR
jgi:hypothetical protein